MVFSSAVCVREECVGVLREGRVSPSSWKTVPWAVEKGAESELGEEELKRKRRLEKAGIKVLPASVRYTRSAGHYSDYSVY